MAEAAHHTPETRFGEWFQGTNIWRQYVVAPAVADLMRLMPRIGAVHILLDVGCGDGGTLVELAHHIQPQRIIALDLDLPPMSMAAKAAVPAATQLEVLQADVCQMPIEEQSIDLVFCHQTLHHTSDPQAALREIKRVMVPGGLLLVAESCESFLSSWPVRLLFRHPPRGQQTARDYLSMVRAAGFECAESDFLATSPWWSQPDAGFTEHFCKRPYRGEPTQVRLVARKP